MHAATSRIHPKDAEESLPIDSAQGSMFEQARGVRNEMAMTPRGPDVHVEERPLLALTAPRSTVAALALRRPSSFAASWATFARMSQLKGLPVFGSGV